MIKRLLRNEKILMAITTMQEAFSAIIPFFLLSSFITLSYFVLKTFHLEILGVSASDIRTMMEEFNAFSSIIATLAIGYFFGLRFKTSPVISAILSVAVFLAVLHIEHPGKVMELPYGFTPAALVMPVVASWLLKLFYPRLSLHIGLRDAHAHIYRHFNYIFVFFFAFFASVILYFFVDRVLDDLVARFDSWVAYLPGIVRLAIRDFFVQIFWFFGIHGSHVVNGLMGKEILMEAMAPHLTYGEFNRIFINIGGAGVGLGMIVALTLYARHGTVWFLTKLSAPFVLFNINTLLLYGVIVLNRFFIVPFLLLPLFNLAVAYGALQLLPVRFSPDAIVWTTPVFVDAYLKGGGTLLLPMLQGVLLIVDIAVYGYYVKRFMQVNLQELRIRKLEENLDLSTELRSREHIRAYTAHWEIMEANSRLEALLPEINKETLFVFYQPKVDPRSGECRSVEALIRYRKEGRLRGPDFLVHLEQAGLATVIDHWVVRQVKKDLDRWRSEGFTPEVSINLHPDTVNSREDIRRIARVLKGESVLFEIVERSFLEREEAGRNITWLQEEGFGISIDDFGSGYSSLETITRYRIDELKLDKSLIDILDTRKGYLVCKYTTRLCHDLGYRVVAEGVEHAGQFEKIVQIGVDRVQGFYFSEALPASDVGAYCGTSIQGPRPQNI